MEAVKGLGFRFRVEVVSIRIKIYEAHCAKLTRLGRQGLPFRVQGNQRSNERRDPPPDA